MNEEIVKLVIFVPLTHTDIVRKAMGNAGAGKLGNYTQCTFSTKGFGRYLPGVDAHPFIGEVGKEEEVEEERIETVCCRKDLEKIIAAIKKVHPYEEIALDIYPLVNISE
jgi:hypothetical protein